MTDQELDALLSALDSLGPNHRQCAAAIRALRQERDEWKERTEWWNAACKSAWESRDAASAAHDIDTAELQQKVKERDELRAANATLRKLLWLRHGCPSNALYGDDGEMQCSKCAIDFLRNEPEVIGNIWHRAGLRALASSGDAKETT